MPRLVQQTQIKGSRSAAKQITVDLFDVFGFFFVWNIILFLPYLATLYNLKYLLTVVGAVAEF